jgi:hypothetical protein
MDVMALKVISYDVTLDSMARSDAARDGGIHREHGWTMT